MEAEGRDLVRVHDTLVTGIRIRIKLLNLRIRTSLEFKKHNYSQLSIVVLEAKAVFLTLILTLIE